MTRNDSGISAPAASGESTHVIQYTATAPDGGEVCGLATVTAVDGLVPFAQLAAIPGFRRGDVIREHDGDPRPALLGPGTDAPGHPAWCQTHDDRIGGGASTCLGPYSHIDGGQDEDHNPGVMSAGLVVTTGEAPRVFIDRSGGDDSVSLDTAREYAHLLLALIAQADAETVAAVAR